MLQCTSSEIFLLLIVRIRFLREGNYECLSFHSLLYLIFITIKRDCLKLADTKIIHKFIHAEYLCIYKFCYHMEEQ